MGIETCRLVRRIAEGTERKTGKCPGDVMGLIRKRIRLELLKATIIALREERGRKFDQTKDITDLDLNLERGDKYMNNVSKST